MENLLNKLYKPDALKYILESELYQFIFHICIIIFSNILYNSEIDINKIMSSYVDHSNILGKTIIYLVFYFLHMYIENPEYIKIFRDAEKRGLFFQKITIFILAILILGGSLDNHFNGHKIKDWLGFADNAQFSEENINKKSKEIVELINRLSNGFKTPLLKFVKNGVFDAKNTRRALLIAHPDKIIDASESDKKILETIARNLNFLNDAIKDKQFGKIVRRRRSRARARARSRARTRPRSRSRTNFGLNAAIINNLFS